MLTSNVPPIRFFGVLSALGVLLVYIVVLFLISPLLKLFTLKQLDKFGYAGENKWGGIVEIIYNSGKNHTRKMLTISAVILLIFTYGMTQITTDIHLEAGMPKNAKITEDFHFFEENFNGFRPFEIAAIAQNNYVISDPVVLREIEKVEAFVKQQEIINGLQSITMVYKSLNRAYNGDNPAEYKLPEDENTFSIYDRDLKRVKLSELNILISEDKKYGRISGFLNVAAVGEMSNIIKPKNKITDILKTASP